jgi:hypothetical protein
MVTLTNNGPAAVELAEPAVAGIHPNDFAVVGGGCTPGSVVAPGEQCTVDVEFTAGAVGERAAELRVPTADGRSATVALLGTGTGSVLAFDPPQVDFGTWAAGSPGPDLKEVRLRNLGNIAVHIAQLGVEGDFGSQDGCTGNVLVPGRDCAVRVRFLPRDEGPRAGRIVALDTAGRAVVAQLQGMGAAPHVSLQPAALDLGDVRLGTSAEGTVTATNTGTWPLTVHDPLFAGPDAADFTLVASCDGAVLQAGKVCKMRLSLTPSAPGPRQATLQFTSNADGGTHDVSLSGTGVP